MSGHVVIQNLGKAYRSYNSEWQRVAGWFGLNTRPKTEHWVLRNISFEVRPGEAVAIIGQNGAGKSTLLKMITGALRPSEGSIQISGKVSAILELGMGFNPEFTARQNVYHAAGLMGYSAEQINQVMPEIEAFAEIGDYFDQPMRTYSSGMQMRVAFAVATAWRPDVLIVDEALSVGDSYFSHKSFARIRQYAELGTTLLFVSHSMGDVRSLCDRAILLGNGTMIKDGLPDEVADYYNALVAAKENAKLSIEQQRNKQGWLTTKSGTGEISIESLSLFDPSNQAEIQIAQCGQLLSLVLLAKAKDAIPKLVLGYMLRDVKGTVIWGTNTWHTKQVIGNVMPNDIVKFTLKFTCSLGPGSYSFTPALVSTDTHLIDNFEWIDNALIFDVVNASHDYFIGFNQLDAQFNVSIEK